MSASKKLKTTDFPTNSENPFMSEALANIKSNTVTRNRSLLGSNQKAVENWVNADNGEVIAQAFMKRVKVDEDKFAKIFLSNFQAFFDLKPQGIKVFGYIIQKLRPNDDRVLFNADEAMKYTKYKAKESIRLGVNQLLDAGIIARSEYDYMYFINPMIVFNGNRVVFATEYVMKNKED